MQCNYSPTKTFFLLTVLIIFVEISILLTKVGLLITLVFGLPIWFFLLPLCLWEIFFMGENLLQTPKINRVYLLSLITALSLFVFFHLQYILIWAFIMCIFLLLQMEVSKWNKYKLGFLILLGITRISLFKV